jgi:SAM-dependent methyltransferase
LFDGVASLYQETRPGYPVELVEFVISTAGVSAGDPVLEVGCGTGQLTEKLASFGFELTAIDIGPSMVAAARLRVGGRPESFLAIGFEDLEAADLSFGLIISGGAFHWVDPEIRFRKAARLLRPGGWLAVLNHSERYDEPFRSALSGMWNARADGDVGAWVSGGVGTDVIAATGLFEEAVHSSLTWRLVRSADAVVGVESTRAISLSWPPDVRQGFTQEMREHLAPAARRDGGIGLTLESWVTMARVRA